MIILLTERKNIKHTSSGARFLEAILSDKEEIIKEIDICREKSADPNQKKRTYYTDFKNIFNITN